MIADSRSAAASSRAEGLLAARPEVECIGKGKPHKPYEFGCKVAVATTNSRAPGGQFVTYIGALHGNPYDGHTLKDTVAGVTAITGLEARS